MNSKEAADMKCPYFISNGDKCIRCESLFYQGDEDGKHRTIHTFPTAEDRRNVMYNQCAFYPNDCTFFLLLNEKNGE